MFLREFRSDWSCLTDEQITESVKYLLKWYRLYPKSNKGDGTVTIGGVPIRVERFYLNSDDNGMYYEIGGRIFYEDSAVGPEIKKLYVHILDETRTVKQRFNFWWGQNKEGVKWLSKNALLPACIGGVVGWYIVRCDDATEAIINEKIEKREQTYPGYRKAKEEMQHYSDSVRRNTHWVWWPYGGREKGN